ncbi:uncharacterized protein A4U43_C03F15890 [Asparagus officinalis]|uniref:Uncharacterized protein n=1 Tax=Asparagus officinalis TaxID=4686 RepID=A0A5P1FD93_ASPOF|nr:uncharacterized protein A4U43_C03F15890 [Asparagus officinalis]
MDNLEYKGSVLRFRKCVFDLLSMEEDIVDDDDCDDEWWHLIERDLRLKSTFLYCDINKVIANAHEEHKEAFTCLANKLFYYIGEVNNAVKSRSLSVTHDCYHDVVLLLHEVMATVIPP